MDGILQWLVRLAILAAQWLPMNAVCGLGRLGGWLAGRLRPAALRRVRSQWSTALGRELPDREREAQVLEYFKRSGESLACMMNAPARRNQEWESRLKVLGLNKLRPWVEREDIRGIVLALAMSGNPTLYIHASERIPWLKPAFCLPAFSSTLQRLLFDELRTSFDCRFYDPSIHSQDLARALSEDDLVLGVPIDRIGGEASTEVEFFGRPTCFEHHAASLALRHGLPIFPVFCFRESPGSWRIEIGDAISLVEDGKPAGLSSLVQALANSLETAVRRDPANWFWPARLWNEPRM